MNNKNVRVIFRLDDITPGMDWDKFNRVKDIFQKYSVVPLIGVVPDNRDATLHVQDGCERFWEEINILQKHGWKIAQHGTYHQYVSESSGILGINPFSEFAGLPYEEQYEKIREGKHILEDNNIITDIFMAPGHTYDKNTIKALVCNGFNIITDGLYKKPYLFEGIIFIPCRLQGYKNRGGLDTICLHTNFMSEKDIQYLEHFCCNNLDKVMPFEPELLKEYAVRRTVWVQIYEKAALFRRIFKNKIAASQRMSWYMNYTNHNNSKIKILKRIGYLPILLFYRADKS